MHQQAKGKGKLLMDHSLADVGHLRTTPSEHGGQPRHRPRPVLAGNRHHGNKIATLASTERPS